MTTHSSWIQTRQILPLALCCRKASTDPSMSLPTSANCCQKRSQLLRNTQRTSSSGLLYSLFLPLFSRVEVHCAYRSCCVIVAPTHPGVSRPAGKWLELLEEYDFSVLHRSGVRHGNADALSRRPCSRARCCPRDDTAVKEPICSVIFNDPTASSQTTDSTIIEP